MQLRSFFSAGPAVSADPWDSTQSQEESSLKKLLIPRPGSPTSPASSGELISTAVPADVSAASSEVTSSSVGGSSTGSSSGSASCSPTRATLEAYQQHTGLTGRQPVVEVADASFEELCHGGFFMRWTWSNWLVKLYRLTLLLIKQIYLFWLALPFSMPTNHVMVSVCACASFPLAQGCWCWCLYPVPRCIASARSRPTSPLTAGVYPGMSACVCQPWHACSTARL